MPDHKPSWVPPDERTSVFSMRLTDSERDRIETLREWLQAMAPSGTIATHKSTLIRAVEALEAVKRKQEKDKARRR